MTAPRRGPAPVPVVDLDLARAPAAVVLRPLARPLGCQQAGAGESNYLHDWRGKGNMFSVHSEDILSISGEQMRLLDKTRYSQHMTSIIYEGKRKPLKY